MARTIGIDLGSTATRVVVGEYAGPVFKLQRVLTIPVEDRSDGDEGSLATIPAVAKALVKAPGARYGISGKELIIRYTSVPPVPTWRLRLLMDFEVREMAHQAGEPLACDYNLLDIPGKGDGDSVLVAVVKERILDARTRALAQSLGPPRGATPSSIALFNAYLQAGELHDGEYVGLVDIGDRNTEIVILKDSELLFARNLPVGGALLTESVAQTLGLSKEDAEHQKDQLGNVAPRGKAAYSSGKEERVANALLGPAGQLASMVQSSLAFSRAQTGIKDLNLARILLSGGTGALRGLDEYLASSMRCKVERFQPSSGLDLSALPGDEADAWNEDPGRYAVALGLAVTGAKPESFVLDIVSDATRKSREFKRRTAWLMAAGAACLAFLGLRFFSLKSTETDLKNEARRMTSQAQQARRQSDEFDALRNRIQATGDRQRILQELTRPGFTLGKAPRLLQDHSPDSIWVEQVDVRRIAVPVDPADPKKGKISRSLAKVTGEVLGVDVQSSTALEQMQTGIQSSEGRPSVDLTKTSGGEAVGSKRLRFEATIDVFPEPADPAPTSGGGN